MQFFYTIFKVIVTCDFIIGQKKNLRFNERLKNPFFSSHGCLSTDKNPASNTDSKFKRKVHTRFTPAFVWFEGK